MGQEPGPSLVKKTSRLPLARSTYTISSGLQASQPPPAHQHKSSIYTLRKQVGTPLGEIDNVQSSLARPVSRIAVLSPTRSTNTSETSASLDTTPPSSVSEFAIAEDGNENASTTKADNDLQPAKRKPRMSLSERTIETLSQIPPSPSPSRRRSSTANSNGSMGPPARPKSQVRQPRPQTPSTLVPVRSRSPIKSVVRPPERSQVATEDHVGIEPIYTPPRAFMRDGTSRIGKPMRDSRRSISTAVAIEKPSQHVKKPSLQPSKMKSLYDLRATANAQQRSLKSKPSLPSLPSLSKNPSTPKTNCSRDHRETSPQASLLKARRPGDNPISRRPSEQSTSTLNTIQSANIGVKRPVKDADAVNRSIKTESFSEKGEAEKIHLSLRDIMAKAKAERKAQIDSHSTADISAPSGSGFVNITSAPLPGEKAMARRIKDAAFTGNLNISASGLRELPTGILHMFDFEEHMNAHWAEAVDLKKLLASDNEIEQLTEQMFPNWTDEEMLNDTSNTKSNIMRSLETFGVQNNRLSSLPLGFQRLGNLHTLHLSGNQFDINTISVVAKLTNLKELRLASNQLKGYLPIDVQDMVNLQILDLRNNNISELPDLSTLKSLRKLLLSGNCLTTITLGQLPTSLLELDISRNKLSGQLDFKDSNNFEKLQELNIAGNEISSISGEFGLPSLCILAVQDNRLITLPDLLGCSKLTALTASNNKLELIPPLSGLDELHHLDLSMNDIKSMGTELESLTSLTAFNIAGNPLVHKRYLTMSIVEIRLDIARKAEVPINEIGSLPSAVIQVNNSDVTTTRPESPMLYRPQSGILDLSSKGLSTVEPESIFLDSPIHTLRLRDNDLSTFPVSLLQHPSIKWSLTTLDLSHNPSLHPTAYVSAPISLPRLQTLNIVSTGLTSLETLTTNLSAPALLSLNISCHRLTGHVPWVRAWYPSLTTLLASDNWFDSLDVEAVRGLEVLDVSNNNIEALPSKIGLFGNMHGKREAGRLGSLECSGNSFRVPRQAVLEKGTEAVLRDLRRMIPFEDVPEEWRGEV